MGMVLKRGTSKVMGLRRGSVGNMVEKGISRVMGLRRRSAGALD